MKDVYEVAGITKQALHKHKTRRMKMDHRRAEIFDQADKIRKEHPGVGCRKMALDLVCKGWGRDKVEQLLLCSGYRLVNPPKYTRTTDTRKEFYYPNLIEGMELNGINQVVQTDITYYRIKDKFYYIVFLIDVYSRRIVGHALSTTLEAKANIKALKGMLQTRKGDALKGLIHHCDRGSQYTALMYRELLQSNGITPSMCKAAWENAYTERINRTIKEEYLDKWEINDYRTLSKKLNRAIAHYNGKRRHTSLGKISPIDFENSVKNLDPAACPKFSIYRQLEPLSTKEV